MPTRIATDTGYNQLELRSLNDYKFINFVWRLIFLNKKIGHVIYRWRGTFKIFQWCITRPMFLRLQLQNYIEQIVVV